MQFLHTEVDEHSAQLVLQSVVAQVFAVGSKYFASLHVLHFVGLSQSLQLLSHFAALHPPSQKVSLQVSQRLAAEPFAQFASIEPPYAKQLAPVRSGAKLAEHSEHLMALAVVSHLCTLQFDITVPVHSVPAASLGALRSAHCEHRIAVFQVCTLQSAMIVPVHNVPAASLGALVSAHCEHRIAVSHLCTLQLAMGVPAHAARVASVGALRFEHCEHLTAEVPASQICTSQSVIPAAQDVIMAALGFLPVAHAVHVRVVVEIVQVPQSTTAPVYGDVAVAQFTHAVYAPAVPTPTVPAAHSLHAVRLVTTLQPVMGVALHIL